MSRIRDASFSALRSLSEKTISGMRRLHQRFPRADVLIKGTVSLACFLLPKYSSYIRIRAKADVFQEQMSTSHSASMEIIDTPIIGEPPLVTIIVPNYNHEKFLRQRLDSVYSQSYTNYEVVLLDDCSNDGSRKILEEYAALHQENTRCFFNDHNSGHVFTQWNLGLSKANGSLIWIAESDDWCDADFLEKMVPCFSRQSVMLAYSRSTFMKDDLRCSDIEEYLRNTDVPVAKGFIRSVDELLSEGFVYRNIIPNVSSAVFRNIGKVPDEVVSEWRHLKLCGDWVFYLSIAKGGCVAYIPDTTNYYRLHEKSTSLEIQSSVDYFTEVERVSKFIARNFRINPELFDRASDVLKAHYLEHHMGSDCNEVDAFYRLNDVKNEAQKRKPVVLMCGFSMKTGGGEVFPIVLADALREMGVTVTFVDFRLDTYNEGMRRKLDSSVPLIELSSPEMIPELFSSFSADIVHSHHASVDRLVSIFIRDGMRQVVTLHGMYETMSDAELDNFLPQICSTCSRFFYISDKNLLPFKERGLFKEELFQKVDNGVRKETHHSVSREMLSIPDDAFVFCLVSRARYDKGWMEAIAAVDDANERTEREVHLILVGDGEVFDTIKDDHSKFIHPVGFQTYPQDYFEISDMGLLPSYFKGESYPLSVIECLLLGKPVIATDVGEVRKLLSDQSSNMAGVIVGVKKNDYSQLLDAICSFENNSEVFNRATNVAECISSRYDIFAIAERYLTSYSLF